MSTLRPGICLITNSRQYSSSPLESQLLAIEHAITAECDFIQIREKHLPRPQLRDFALRCLDLARNTSTRIIINRDWELALELGVWGVHLNSSQAFPPERGQLQVGASTHKLEEALSAQSAGADYVFLGPIFPPNSKTTSSILGPEAFAAISAVLEVPVFALGGITVSNASAAISAGADGVAGIGLFADPERIQETILGLRREMESGREGASNRNGRN